MNEFAQKAGKNVDAVCRKATLDLFTEIVVRSPVDTGRFVGNWQISQNLPAVGSLELTDKTKSGAMAQASKAITFAPGGVVYFANNLPYAVRLEHGWSKTKAPQGMVRVSVRAFNENLQRLASQA